MHIFFSITKHRLSQNHSISYSYAKNPDPLNESGFPYSSDFSYLIKTPSAKKEMLVSGSVIAAIASSDSPPSSA